jgi:hypothetical protein
VRQAYRVLVAQHLVGETALGHRHQRAVLTRLERELDGEVEGEPIGPGFGRCQAKPTWRLDHLEDVPMVVELVARRAEGHRPLATDA